MIYVTYAISDPDSRLVVYIGQTSDFERRVREHQSSHRLRKAPPKSSIKHWLWSAQKEGRKPVFTILEAVITEAESLASESRWVETFAALGHPLYNRWSEHQALIEAAQAPVAAVFDTFWPGRWNKVIAIMKPTPRKAGFKLSFQEETTIPKSGSLVVLPRRLQVS
ncbi:MAG: GIY-YIG nuclease family protein [Pseudomonadota bacterium]